MKKLKILALMLCMVLAGASCYAQQLDLIPYHYVNVEPLEGYEVLNLMRQRDGDYVSKATIAYDVVFYKVSPTSLEITDSLCIHHQDGMGWYDMIAQDPRGEGNLCVTTVPDGEGGVNLRISHFNDDSFVVDPSEDIVVPLCDRRIYYYSEGKIDCRGDIIWKYYPALTDSTYESHFARFGLDGTLKHDATLTPNGIFIDFGVFSEQPLRYYQWKRAENLYLYVYDSLFQQENYYVINKGFHPEYDASLVYFNFSYFGVNRTFVIPDGDDVLVTAIYDDFSIAGFPSYNALEVGTAVARYDLRTMQQKGFVMFNDYPGQNNEVMNLGFFKSSNGSLYLIYKEQAWDEHGYEISLPITAVKMDANLNVLWKHYIYMPKDHFIASGVDRTLMTEDENEVKIVIVGGSVVIDKQTMPYTYTPGLYYFFLTDDDPLETDESEIKIRPYGFWPNPTHDQLCLQYSPDVQPIQIELYDLQGCLVRTKTTGFESLSMAGLAAGQYVLKVALENGKVYMDKVVKE